MVSQQTIIHSGLFCGKPPPKWQQQQWAREAKAAEYKAKQQANRSAAHKVFVPAATAVLSGGSLLPVMLPTLEFIGGAAGTANRYATDHPSTANTAGGRINRAMQSRGVNLTSSITGGAADVAQFVTDPVDIQNNAELGIDIVKTLGDFDVLKKIPRYGAALDKAADVVSKYQNYNDGILKPIYNAINWLSPQWLKDYINLYDELQKIQSQSQQQFKIK